METVRGQKEKNCREHHDSVLTVEGIRPSEGKVQLRAWSMRRPHIALEVHTSIFSLDSVLRAAYKFTDRAYIFLSWVDKKSGRLGVILASKSPNEDPDSLVGAFANELLDQRVRDVVEK